MPELPEVETIRRGLSAKLKGKTILKVIAAQSKINQNQLDEYKNTLKGAKVLAVRRRGKLLIVECVDGQNHRGFPPGNPGVPADKFFLLIHLKMTGQLVYRKNNKILPGGHELPENPHSLPNKYTYITFVFTDGGQLFFNDQRKFAYSKIVDNKGLEKILDGFGIEPLTDDFTLKNFKRVFYKNSANSPTLPRGNHPCFQPGATPGVFANYLQVGITPGGCPPGNPRGFSQLGPSQKTAPVKNILLNQKLIAGIGNIYADEICFDAGVKPQKSVAELTNEDITKLFLSTNKLLKLAIENGGTTFRNYRDSSGKKGGFRQFLKVYQQDGKKCLRCKTINMIKKIKIGGRGTHYCPGCQS